MMEHELFRVTDLKEYTFCPRVLYYENCLPDLRPSTYKMQAGVHAHEQERKRAARRTLAAYGLEQGERYFDLTLMSEKLRLIGEIDEVVLTPDEAIIVDYKLTREISDNFKMQITAYAMLIEEHWQVKVHRGFFYLLMKKKFEPLAITTKLRDAVRLAVQQMSIIVDREHVPAPPVHRKKCVTCKHRRFCNDV